MKIVQLTASNIKRLRAVNIKPDGNVVIVGGKNGQGKTSLLDAIAMALGGMRLVPAKPIRSGETRAEVAVDLGELRVRRTFTANGSYLTVENADGSVFRSPQNVLDKIVGDLTFDPEQFTRMEPKQQVETLLRLAKIDLADLNERRASAYNERRDIRRRVNEESAILRSMTEPEDSWPTETRGTEDITKKMDIAAKLRETNTSKRIALGEAMKDYEAAANRSQHYGEEVLDLMGRLAEAERKSAEAERQLAEQEKVVEAAKLAVKEMIEPDDEKLKREMADLEYENSLARARMEYGEQSAAVESLSDQADALSQKIRELDEEKGRILSSAEFPVEDLAFDEDGVIYKGEPFEQAGKAEKTIVSAAIGIAMNPKLKVLFYRDASLLDEESLSLVKELAEKRDCQVWLERVGDEGRAQVIIEDGTASGPAVIEEETEKKEGV